MTSRSLVENFTRGLAAAVCEPDRGSTLTILYVEGSTITISSRTTTKLYPRYRGTIWTISAGNVCRRTFRGTTVPTATEKLTLLSGCTFRRAIDWDIRVCCCTLTLADTLVLVLDEGA